MLGRLGLPERTPLVAGGVPPYGQDMTGILYTITIIQQWQSAGGSFKYDASCYGEQRLSRQRGVGQIGQHGFLV